MNPYDEISAVERQQRLRAGAHDEYLLYLRSQAWRTLRADLIKQRGYACEHCGRSYLVVLDVHHKRYTRLGNEIGRDLEVLCRPCHEDADRKRRHRYWRVQTGAARVKASA